MRIVMIGAGAMGSLFAWRLAQVEVDLWVYDRWGAHIDAIRRDGLIVRYRGARKIVRLRATTDPAQPGVADVAMLFVKFGQTREALEFARPIIGTDTIIVTLQNGIGNVDIIRLLLPRNRIVYGFTTLTSELTGPGHIDASYAGQGETYLWPEDGRVDERVEAIPAALNQAGVNTCLSPDTHLTIWKKLAVNCSLNPICAVTGLTVGALVDTPGVWPVLDGVADEVCTAAALKGIRLAREEARSFVRTVAEEAREHEPSMLVDLRQRRKTEIDCLNGAVLAVCDAHGTVAPLNRMLYTIVRAIEMNHRNS